MPEVRWLTGIQATGIALTLVPMWLGWQADDSATRQQLLLVAALIPVAVAPLAFAWDLHRAWPEAQFRLVQEAGHSAFDPENTAALVRATDQFAGA